MEFVRSRRQAVSRSIIVVAVIVVVAVGGGLAYYLIPQAPSGPPNIKIGVLTSLTGQFSFYGADQERGAELAIKQINSHGGIFVKSLGRNLTLQAFVEDQGDTSALGVQSMNKLIFQANVDAVVGSLYTTIMLAAEPVAVKEGVPFIMTGGNIPQLTQRTDLGSNITYAFVLYQNPIDEASAYVEFAAHYFKPLFAPNRNLTMGLLNGLTSYDSLWINTTKATIASEHLPITLISVRADGKATDFHAPLLQLKNANPDFIALAGVGELAETEMITQGVRDLGLNLPLLVQNVPPDAPGLSQDYFKYQVDAEIFSPYNTALPMAQTFATNYHTTYNATAGGFAASEYDGIIMLANAIKAAGTLDKAQVRDALTHISLPPDIMAFPGGSMAFPANRILNPAPALLQYSFSGSKVTGTVLWPLSLKNADYRPP